MLYSCTYMATVGIKELKDPNCFNLYCVLWFSVLLFSVTCCFSVIGLNDNGWIASKVTSFTGNTNYPSSKCSYIFETLEWKWRHYYQYLGLPRASVKPEQSWLRHRYSAQSTAPYWSSLWVVMYFDVCRQRHGLALGHCSSSSVSVVLTQIY